jgi:hypothetical protein
MEKVWKLVWLCVVVLPLMATGCSKDDDDNDLNYSLTGTTWVYEEEEIDFLGGKVYVGLRWTFVFTTRTEFRIYFYVYEPEFSNTPYEDEVVGRWEYTPPIVKFKAINRETGELEELHGIIDGNTMKLYSDNEEMEFTLQ